MPQSVYTKAEIDAMFAARDATLADHESRILLLESGPPPAAPTATFTATPGTVESGQASLLEWSTTGATSVTLDGVSVALSGSQSVSPTADTTYTLIATGPGGSVTKTVTVTVTQPGGFQWPGPSGDVVIPTGQTVVVDTLTASARDITVHGTLRFQPGVSTRLECRTLTGDGTLEIGTDLAPVQASAKIVIRDVPLDPTDTEQIGNGVHWMGMVSICGQAKTPYLRLAGSQNAGDTVLTLTAAPVGWQVGDELAIADSRYINDPSPANMWTRDRVTITAVNGNQVTVTPLALTHPQATDLQGNPVPGRTAHAANLTRNVVIESANPSGVRGHFMVMGPMASADICHAVFKDLGRTTFGPIPPEDPANVIGRYPLHFHLMGDAGANVHCHDNVVDGGMSEHNFKWGLTVHGTNYGTFQNNVIFNMMGAGVAVEDGSEHHNLFEGNLVILVRGDGASRADGNGFPGREGVGFWANNTTNNRYRNNVATGCSLHGFTFFGGGPFLEFAGNESYGHRNGMTMWYINGADTGSPNPAAPESFIANFTAWHCWENGVGLGYPAYNVTFTNLYANNCYNGWWFGDYRTRNLKLVNPTITKCVRGIVAPMVDAPSEFIIDHPVLSNSTWDVSVGPQIVSGGGGWTPQARTVRIIAPTWNPAKLENTDTDPADSVVIE